MPAIVRACGDSFICRGEAERNRRARRLAGVSDKTPDPVSRRVFPRRPAAKWPPIIEHFPYDEPGAIQLNLFNLSERSPNSINMIKWSTLAL